MLQAIRRIDETQVR